MKGRTTLLCLILLSLIVGCGPTPRQRVTAVLVDVESYINTRPDSALAALQGLDTTVLTTRALRARYSLLHVMALYKNYRPISAPGLLEEAIDYYSRHGNADEKLKTFYYQGCIMQEQRDLNAAAIAFSQAEEYARQATDSHAVALLYEAFSSVYNAVHNTDKELEYAEKALARMEASGDPMYGSALGNLAMAYHTRREWAFADSLYRAAIAYSESYTQALAGYLSNYARMKLLSPERDPAGALELLNRKKEMTGGTLTPKEVGAYAYASELLGNRNRADVLVKQLQAVPDSSWREVVSWLYRISLARGDYQEALNYLREMRKAEYDEVVGTLTDSVTQALRDHSLQMVHLERERKLRQGIWMLCLVSMLLIMAVCLLYRGRVLRLERDRLISICTSLERDLREQEDRTEAYSSALSSKLDYLREQLQRERLDKLHKRGRYGYWLWMEQNDRSSDQEVIRSLRRDLKEICEAGNDYHALERRMDMELEGMVTRLKRDLGMKSGSDDERFLCYWIGGLRADMIAELMGMTTNNVYVRTHRLEKRIRLLDNPEYQSLIKK